MRQLLRLLWRRKKSGRQALGPRALAWQAAAGGVAAAGVAAAQAAAGRAAIVVDAQLHTAGAAAASIVDPS